MELKNLIPRQYQEAILETSKDKNTLIVLPTGLGKTACAIMLAIDRLNKYPNSKILVCSPSKPLCSQHAESFKEYTNLNENEIVLLTGATHPRKREELWKDKKIIVATPQTIDLDIKHNRLSLKEFSMLCIDEAHRSKEKFANTIVSKNYMKNSLFPRILALTASPGSTKENIDEICKNLYIEAVEIRTETDEDIKPHLQQKEINWIELELPQEYKEIYNLINSVYKEKLSHLQNYGITKPISLINKKDLLHLQKEFQDKIKKNNPLAYSGISLVAQLLKLNHALELIETQGISSLREFFKKIQKETSKAASSIRHNKNIIKAIESSNKINLIHPKLEKLASLIQEELKNNQNSRVIVFANFRFTVDEILNHLKNFKEIKAAKLIGQKEGLTQKRQIEVIKQFENKIYNVLVTSSIGEEGLSIKGADLAIFFDHVYGLRRIQRAGRVARTMPGKIIFLITKGTRDAAMYWKSKRDISKMTYILKRMQKKENQSSLW